MPRAARVAVRHVRRDGMDLLKKMEKDHKISQDEHKRQDERGPEGDRRDDRRDRQAACRQGKGDHDGLSDAARSRSDAEPLPQWRAAASRCRGTSPSSWMATDAGPPARGLPRVEGHRRGVEALRRTVRAAGEIGIAFLTIFSFSSENWSRPPSEIRDLMGLLRRFIRNDLADLHKTTCACASSASATVSTAISACLLQEAEELTRDNDRPDAGRRLQLRRAPGDRARRAPPGDRGRRKAGCRARRHHAELFGAQSRTRPICPIPT